MADRLQGATEDDALDMFADSLDKQPSAAGDGRPADAEAPPAADAGPSGGTADGGGQAESASKPDEQRPANGQSETSDSAAIGKLIGSLRWMILGINVLS